MKLRWMFFATLLLALCAVAPMGRASAAGPGPGTSIDLKTKLHDPRSTMGVRGTAEYKIRNDGSRTFNVTLFGVMNKGNQRLDVFVNGTKVGSLTSDTTMAGTYRLTLDTRNHDKIPDIRLGATVEVKRADGTVIATGTF